MFYVMGSTLCCRFYFVYYWEVLVLYVQYISGVLCTSLSLMVLVPQLQAQKLRLSRTRGLFYGGSLPNVHQIGRSPPDFQVTPFVSTASVPRLVEALVVTSVYRTRGTSSYFCL